jgi:hypothetical protein
MFTAVHALQGCCANSYRAQIGGWGRVFHRFAIKILKKIKIKCVEARAYHAV